MLMKSGDVQRCWVELWEKCSVDIDGEKCKRRLLMESGAFPDMLAEYFEKLLNKWGYWWLIISGCTGNMRMNCFIIKKSIRNSSRVSFLCVRILFVSLLRG